MSAFAEDDSQCCFFLPFPASPLLLRYASLYCTKKREVICSSRYSRASQSPLMVEKQLMPHAEYAKPTYTIRVRKGYDCISRGHSLLLLRPLANVAKIQSSREQRQ